jgi:hypothetical protein
MMQVRHFFTLAAILLVAILHFAVQWYAWKVHLFEIPLGDSLLGPPADYLWKVSSWPLFHIVSGRTQHLHFLAVLLGNSLAWGAAFTAATTSVWRLAQRVRNRRRKQRAEALAAKPPIKTTPPTRVERIIELNSLLNRRRITEEEYRVMRKAIMREQEPEPDAVGSRVIPNTAVTYTVPPDGAQHVAWLDEVPRGARKRRGEARNARSAPASAGRPTVRGR